MAIEDNERRGQVKNEQVTRRPVALPKIGQTLVFQGKLPDPDVPDSDGYRSDQGLVVLNTPSERTVSASYAHRAPTDEEISAIIQAFYPNATWEEDEGPVGTIRFARALEEPEVLQ